MFPQGQTAFKAFGCVSFSDERLEPLFSHTVSIEGLGRQNTAASKFAGEIIATTGIVALIIAKSLSVVKTS